jgi:hypothetical protein
MFVCMQRELAYLAAGVSGDGVDMLGAIDVLSNEDAGARYVAGKVNAAFGREVVKVPPPPPTSVSAGDALAATA